MAINTSISASRDSSLVKTQAKAWVVVLTAALFFFYEFIQMNMISSLNQDLMLAFQVDATKLGILTSCYFIANVLFLLPAGQMLDRFSTKKIILISLAICVAGTFLFGISNSLTIAAIFRFMTGIGSAFCFLACIRLASRWFPPKRMALISGLIVTMAMLGGWVAQSPFTHVVEWLGWRHAVRIDAVFGMFIMLLIILFVKDYPQGTGNDVEHQHEALHDMGYWQTLRHAYLNKQNLLCGLYTSLMNLPIFFMGAVWGSLYLEQVHHFSRNQATLITGMIFFGTVFGSPLAGWISDMMGKRKKPMLIGVVLYLILILGIIYIPHINFTTYLVLFFLLGLLTSTQVISYPMVAESNSIALTATSVSVVSFITIGGGGVFFIPLFGWLMDFAQQSSPDLIGRSYSAHSFYIAMLIMPITGLLAFIVAALTKETNCSRDNI